VPDQGEHFTPVHKPLWLTQRKPRQEKVLMRRSNRVKQDFEMQNIALLNWLTPFLSLVICSQ
jgi:hypothetical protein